MELTISRTAALTGKIAAAIRTVITEESAATWAVRKLARSMHEENTSL